MKKRQKHSGDAAPGGRVFPFAIAGLLIVGLGLVIAASQGWLSNDREPLTANIDQPEDEPDTGPERQVENRPLSEALGLEEEDMVEVGGVLRPRRDIESAEPVMPTEPLPSRMPVRGVAPTLKGDENPQVAAFFEEVKEGRQEALSTRVLPIEFDRGAYERNPEQYLSKIRPGRVFQPAQPGPEVVPIEAASSIFNSVLQGEKVILEVKADP
ncbi:MAG: hypothetical protein AAF456_18045, partial [Planctomycetota bacterium]